MRLKVTDILTHYAIISSFDRYGARILSTTRPIILKNQVQNNHHSPDAPVCPLIPGDPVAPGCPEAPVPPVLPVTPLSPENKDAHFVQY